MMYQTESMDETQRMNPISRRNKVGLVSLDEDLTDAFGEGLSKSGFKLTSIGLEKLATGAAQDFYFIDLHGLLNYEALRNQIVTLREQRPSSEIMLLQEQNGSQERGIPIQETLNKHLVEVSYARPSQSASKDGLEKFVDAQISFIERFLSKPHLVKFGGSLLDLYKERPEVIQNNLRKMLELHEAGYSIILSLGGGPRKDVDGALRTSLDLPSMPLRALKDNAYDIAEALGVKGNYFSPSRLTEATFTQNYLSNYIPVLVSSGDSTIPESDSDAHTLKIAEENRLPKAIFLKDTEGVYKSDPKGGGLFKSKSQFFPHIYSSQILNGEVNRTGADGQGEHLIETRALRFLQLYSHYVRTVQIVDGNKPGNLQKAFDGKFVGSFILRG